MSEEIETKNTAENSKENSDKKRSLHCAFCITNEEPDYKDVNKLKKFLNERSMIVSRQKTRLCAYHQRKLATAVRRARNLALLPSSGKRAVQ